MTSLDTFLQKWRIKKALDYIPQNATILDIGCNEGELLKEAVKCKNATGIGIDPYLPEETSNNSYSLVRSTIENWKAGNNTFNCICMLAVLEHVEAVNQISMAKKISALASKECKLIITVPHKQVDFILAVLKRLKLIDGMHLEEHYGFDIGQTIHIFKSVGFKLKVHQKFQLGLNNLFVFQKN